MGDQGAELDGLRSQERAGRQGQGWGPGPPLPAGHKGWGKLSMLSEPEVGTVKRDSGTPGGPSGTLQGPQHPPHQTLFPQEP